MLYVYCTYRSLYIATTLNLLRRCSPYNRCTTHQEGLLDDYDAGHDLYLGLQYVQPLPAYSP